MLSTKPIKCPPYLLEKAGPLPALPTAIVGAGSPLPLESAKMAQGEGLIKPLLVGNPSRINALANDLEWNISDLRIVSASDETEAASVAVDLARRGEVQALMKGQVHTDTLLRAVLNRDKGLRTEAFLSHVFHMTIPDSDRVLCITDAVLNILPSEDEKMHIVRNVIDLMHALGNPEPRIAMLSGTEQETSAMPSSIEAANVTRRATGGAIQGAIVDGPLAMDIAISPDAARGKGINSPVAGYADVLVVPNLEAGNFLFKKMVYFMSAAAAGLVLGAKVPVILNSRSDAAASRLASAALAVIYAHHLSTGLSH